MPKIILVNQVFDTGDEKWSRYSCGICAIKMLMVFKKPELKDVPIMTLLDQALEMDGYIENVGWKHQVLVDLAGRYGVAADFQRDFYNTPEKKKAGIKIVNNQLSILKLPVAVSVLKDFKISGSAHLVVIEGLAKFGPFIRGYKIVDSHPGERGNCYTVSKKEFLAAWRGGMIYLS